MARVLVTGGAGFIGSHVADALRRARPRRDRLDDLSGGFTDNVPAGARFVQGSVTDPAAVDRLFAETRFDYVYHLAAYAAEGLSHFIKRFNYTNNVIGSVNLINASINTGVKGFVFSSSIAVYGSAPGPMSEETPPDPEDPYGIAKFAVEQDLRVVPRDVRPRLVIFRPHNVYGPRQNIGDRYRNVVGIFMNQILQDQPMTIFGDGTQTRAFSYIDDVAPVIAEAIEHADAWGGVFNIGADEPCTLNDLADGGRGRDGRRTAASSICRRARRSATPDRPMTSSPAPSADGRRRRSRRGSAGWLGGRKPTAPGAARRSTASKSRRTSRRRGARHEPRRRLP